MTYKQFSSARIDRLAIEFDTIQREYDRLRQVCAEAYQMAGALGAPVKALDNLSAAASGKPIPHETFLPVFCERDEAAEKLAKALLYSKNTAKVMVYNCGHPRGGCPPHCDPLVKIIAAAREALANYRAERRVK